ncbi:MAG: hypothetical protein A2W80_06925 [Candidatus Riflebacteria bacterium GWC2_50_8]|nr:MAG: hypothetical protein A2W80_06925 [Candidatus Riflebacteria bacterium GWC2_50_8]
MGFFPTLLAGYIIFAFMFQTVAVGFIAQDNRCEKHRAGWALLTLLTGPVGILIYMFKGRKHFI